MTKKAHGTARGENGGRRPISPNASLAHGFLLFGEISPQPPAFPWPMRYIHLETSGRLFWGGDREGSCTVSFNRSEKGRKGGRKAQLCVRFYCFLFSNPQCSEVVRRRFENARMDTSIGLNLNKIQQTQSMSVSKKPQGVESGVHVGDPGVMGTNEPKNTRA